MRKSVLIHLVALAFVAMGCCGRSSTFRLDDIERDQWPSFRQIGDDIASRFGFDSAAEEYLGDTLESDGRFVVLASYSNLDRGLLGVSGGLSNVWISVFAQPEEKVVDVVVTDYRNRKRSEYIQMIEAALADAVGREFPTARVEWKANLTCMMEP